MEIKMEMEMEMEMLCEGFAYVKREEAAAGADFSSRVGRWQFLHSIFAPLDYLQQELDSALATTIMGTAKRVRKFGAVKRLIGQNDARLKKNQTKGEDEAKKKESEARAVRKVPQVSSALFFQYNTALVPPYSILLDTNFLSHTVQRKLPLLETLMDTLYANCIPIITSCVMGLSSSEREFSPNTAKHSLTRARAAELEKLGPKYRIALRIARDERWERLQCDHKGVYADDCIVDRVMKSKIYLVATNDRELKRRIRKVPGVPIISVARGNVTLFLMLFCGHQPARFPSDFGQGGHPTAFGVVKENGMKGIAATRNPD
ncbi:hypothetical protein JHW43_005219 [Diplocarpon mali]|nr:hypothetical protein JHW43_005219 [Diplocarpon mali]